MHLAAPMSFHSMSHNAAINENCLFIFLFFKNFKKKKNQQQETYYSVITTDVSVLLTRLTYTQTTSK